MDGRSSLIGTIIFAGAILILAGCTVGNYGALVARYTPTDTAVVMDVYSLGFQIRPSQPDLGATLGYRHASYVFPRDDALSHPPASGWRWFNAPWLSGELITRANTSWGIELQATPEVNRLAVGYIDQMITVGPTPDESKMVRLYYNRQIPQQTYVSIKVVEGESDR